MNVSILVVSVLVKLKSEMYLKCNVLSRFYRVTIDGVWIGNWIY
jgi:hypothetical protein